MNLKKLYDVLFYFSSDFKDSTCLAILVLVGQSITMWTRGGVGSVIKDIWYVKCPFFHSRGVVGQNWVRFGPCSFVE